MYSYRKEINASGQSSFVLVDISSISIEYGKDVLEPNTQISFSCLMSIEYGTMDTLVRQVFMGSL